MIHIYADMCITYLYSCTYILGFIHVQTKLYVYALSYLYESTRSVYVILVAGPWAHGPRPMGPGPKGQSAQRAHRPMAQGQSAQRAPWDPQGRPPWDPKGPPLGSQGTP